MNTEGGQWEMPDNGTAVDEEKIRLSNVPSEEQVASAEDNTDNNSLESDVSCTEETSSPSRSLANITLKPKKKRKSRDKLIAQKISIFNFMQEERNHSEVTDSCIFSVYITSYQNGDQETVYICPEKFTNAIRPILRDKFKLRQTSCGLIAFFLNEDDIERVLKLKLAKIFGGPIQVIRFPKGDFPYKRFVLAKGVPWCISTTEIRCALKMQGITTGQIVRNRNNVRIEIFNACDLERMIQEGLNFYNCTSFPVVLENSSNINYGEQSIVQCFNCQGFWHTSSHCRHETKCVRCGDNHDVENCPRSRNDPICCHCGGPHHAAYKHCPVRLQHLNSIQVAFSLAKNKPRRQYHVFR